MLQDLIERSDVFEAITDACSHLLRTHPDAQECREYIDARLSKEFQARHSIGYFPSTHNLDVMIELVGREALEKFSIIYPKYTATGSVLKGHFNDHSLVMPFRNVHGDIVSILGRSILPDSQQKELKIQKYKYSINADKELYVYGLDLAKKSILEKDFVICVEGQFDCIACHKMGIDNVVALGWATLSRYQAYQLSKYTKNIVLMFDNDSAGKKGVARAKSKYGGIVNIESLFPPQGYKDIDEFFKKEASIERKENAISLLKNLR